MRRSGPLVIFCEGEDETPGASRDPTGGDFQSARIPRAEMKEYVWMRDNEMTVQRAPDGLRSKPSRDPAFFLGPGLAVARAPGERVQHAPDA
jgi:hypothetical protein